MVMAAGCLWGTFGILTRITYANTTVGPISLALYRLVFAIPIFGLLVVFKKYPVSMSKRDLLLFVGFGFCSLTVFEALYFTAFAYTTIQHAAALLYTAPAFVAILSWLILKESLTRMKIVAVTVSVAGAFLMMGVIRGEPLFGSRTQIGDWLAVASGLAYSSWYIFGKILGRNRDPAVTALFGMCFGGVMLIPVVVAFEGLHFPNSVIAWELIAAVGLIPTALAYLLYLTGLKHVEATKASVIAIMEPLTAAVLAFFFFQETLSFDSFLGFALIVSSILLISTAR